MVSFRLLAGICTQVREMSLEGIILDLMGAGVGGVSIDAMPVATVAMASQSSFV